MRWLIFLSRVAFICNVFFLFAFSLQLLKWFRNEDAESLVIILGYAMAGVLNPAANACYLFLYVSAPAKLAFVPRWLWLANMGFLILQTIFITFLHGR